MSASHPHRGDVYDPSCSARDVLELIASKWVMLILPALAQGPLRNGELLRKIRGISQKVLTQTLKDLERNGLVSRLDIADVRPHVKYDLTELGRSLCGTLEVLDRWAETHFPALDQAKEQYDLRHDCGACS